MTVTKAKAAKTKKVTKQRKFKKAVTAAKAKSTKKKGWNFINSWKYSNKKSRYDITIRWGTFTIFEIYYCPCDRKGCKRFKLMIANFGVEK